MKRLFSVLAVMTIIYAQLALIFFFVYVVGFFVRNGVKNTVKRLKKRPGPFKDPTGRDLYVWIDGFGEQEPMTIGAPFEFRLLTKPPPPDRKIPSRPSGRVRHGKMTEDGRCDFGEEGSSNYHFPLMPFLPAWWNIRLLRHFIATSVHDTDSIPPTEEFRLREEA